MKKKGVVLCAALLAMTLVFSSCGKENKTEETDSSYADSNVNVAGQLPIVKDKISLTIGIRDYRYVKDFETNEFTKWLEEQTNIDLNFVTFPTSNHIEKFRLLVASESQLPDILINFGLGKVEVLKLGQDGVFLNLKNMIEHDGYYIDEMFKIAKEPEFLKKSMTAYDGGMYFVPSYIEQPGNDYGRKAFINKTWLDKLGLEMPETTEDLEKVLTAFKEKDPNGNGKADEIGITGSKNGWNESVVPFLMNSFIYDDAQDRMQVKNGKVSPIYTTEEWRAGLRYIHSLAEKGLFDTQCFTQDSSTLKTLAQNPEGSLLGAVTTGSPDALFGVGNERLGEYAALPPLKGPKGVAYAIKEQGGANDGGIITRDCKNPLAAFRLPGIKKMFGIPDGASLLAAIVVLAIMILPSIIKVSLTALEAVPKEFEDASLALGATPVETYFRVSVPAAKSGIAAAVVLGVGRAIGEAMAVMMVSGNAPNMPSLFQSVRFLTTAVASEMSYSAGLQRQALFSIALVLFLFIMLINAVLNCLLKRGGEK